MNYSPKVKRSNVHYFALPIGTVHGKSPAAKTGGVGPDSAGILQSADARCGALYPVVYRCSEAAIPPYFMQIIDPETQYAYEKNNLSIQCEQTRPRIFFKRQHVPNSGAESGVSGLKKLLLVGALARALGVLHLAQWS